MRRCWTRALLALVSVAGTVAGASAEPPWAQAAAAELEAAARGFDGEVSVYVRDVRTGVELGLDEATPTFLGSGVKLAVLLTALRQLDAGTLSLEEELVFEAEDVRDGMSALARQPPGTRLSVGTLLRFMMVRSDNAAADLLFDRVGVAEVNAELRRRKVRFGPVTTLIDVRRRVYSKLSPAAAQLSGEQIRVLGKHGALTPRARHLSLLLGQAPPWSGRALDAAFRAVYQEQLNSAPVEEVGRLIAQLATCEDLSPGSCALAHALMRACRTGERRILAGLREGAVWAHKTGTQHRRACDSGWVEVPARGPVIIAACARDFWRVSDAERFLADVGRIVTEALERDARSDPRRPP